MLRDADRTELTPRAFVTRHANVFAVVDAATQDSGNVSYGARIGEQRFFVKTAGSPGDSRPLLSHEDGVALPRNAVRLAGAVSDPALPPLRNVVESVEGPMVVWIASDFYDGSLICDFARRCMHVVDLDSYRDVPFTNDMGRMSGSSRFMAPEEHKLGARIDERTTVFAMGRTVAQFLSLGTHSGR